MNKNILIIFLLIIIAILAFMGFKQKYATSPTTSEQTINNEYNGWKSGQWNTISFLYPPEFNLTPKYQETVQVGFLLEGPSSENQVILIGNRTVYNGNDNDLEKMYNAQNIKDVWFIIPKGLSEESQNIFLQIVNSAKKI